MRRNPRTRRSSDAADRSGRAGQGSGGQSRLIDGVLLLDKPLGLSSTAAGLRVRRLLGATKAGHVGSLDPLATGMLPICLGEATKLAGEILDGDKVYQFRIRLGRRTSTGDVEGEVVATAAVPPLERGAVEAVLRSFLGESQQVPPMYSAIKQAGQPLYKLARAGVTVERKPRAIRIQRLDLLTLEPDALELRVECGKGTYVRVLAEDIATALGTVGHVDLLRRQSVQPFTAERMVTLEALQAALDSKTELPLIAPAEAVGHLPAVNLAADAARRLQQGQIVSVAEGAASPAGVADAAGEITVRVLGPEGRFLGLGRLCAPGRLAAKRLVAQPLSE
ncbi:MAG: tRNA pseudouridine(55) synthase TruB [Sinobacteraceae bacterium]|nr:tRNA pseudouridine(55) synthase TruB [Nevskiaceae bacterium]